MFKIVLMYALPIVLAIYALVDCAQTEPDQVRGLPKLVWVALIALIWVVGPVAWLIGGRERDAVGVNGPAGSQRSRTAPRRTRALAPDDDPAFLESLRRGNEEQRRMLDTWERDLRRSEEQDRRREERDRWRDERERDRHDAEDTGDGPDGNGPGRPAADPPTG